MCLTSCTVYQSGIKHSLGRGAGASVSYKHEQRRRLLISQYGLPSQCLFLVRLAPGRLCVRLWGHERGSTDRRHTLLVSTHPYIGYNELT